MTNILKLEHFAEGTCHLYQAARVAITKNHRLNGFKRSEIYFLIILEAGSPISRYKQGGFW